MTHTFKHDDLTISVRARNGLDDLDAEILRRIVLDHATQKPGVSISEISERDWHRVSIFVDMMQQSTITGKGLTLPATDDSNECIGKGYDDWLAYIAAHNGVYNQWKQALGQVDKVNPDPQPQSDSDNSDSE